MLEKALNDEEDLPVEMIWTALDKFKVKVIQVFLHILLKTKEALPNT